MRSAQQVYDARTPHGSQLFHQKEDAIQFVRGIFKNHYGDEPTVLDGLVIRFLRPGRFSALKKYEVMPRSVL